jgi:hypothetical protein
MTLRSMNLLLFFAVQIPLYKGQNRELYKDTCLLLVPNKVSASDAGFKIVSNCPVVKMHLEFRNKRDKFIFSSDSLVPGSDSYYVPLWKYKKGEYKWVMKHSYIHNGQTVEKTATGTVVLDK